MSENQFMTMWECKKYSIHYYDLAEHDCGYLASLALRTKLRMKDCPTKTRRLKRQRANTTKETVEK